MKLIQKSLMPRIAAVCAALTTLIPLLASGGTPEYLAYYNPTKGFKPAQTNLTNIFLQAAGSLECKGSPEPYLRHMQAEHQRIAAKYKDKTGREMQSHWPAYMTDEYIDTLISNWNLLSPKLRLDGLAKDAGLCTRNAISNSGTLMVGIFNHHQNLVVDAMESGKNNVRFEQLKAVLSSELEFSKSRPEQSPAALAEQEKALTQEERKEYASLLKHEHFTKAEFGQMEHFYSHAFDKLSEGGKDQMSRRVWGGIRPSEPEDKRKGAVSAAAAFRGQLTNIFDVLDSSLAPKKADELKTVITVAFLDLGRVIHAELELGMLENTLK